MEDDTLGSGYPGVNRLYYFLGRVVLILIVVFSVMFFGPESVAFTVVSIAAMVAGIWLDVMRLRNIGVSRWFVFLRYLPFVSLLFWIGTQSAQPGWAETRRLDRRLGDTGRPRRYLRTDPVRRIPDRDRDIRHSVSIIETSVAVFVDPAVET